VLVYGGGCYVFFLEVFPTRTRFTSAAFSYNIAYGIFGGTAPLVGTALVEWTGYSASPGFYMAALAAVALGLALVLRVPETKGLNR
jgi:MHS family proline/betaine transporter-like MFS transporter